MPISPTPNYAAGQGYVPGGAPIYTSKGTGTAQTGSGQQAPAGTGAQGTPTPLTLPTITAGFGNPAVPTPAGGTTPVVNGSPSTGAVSGAAGGGSAGGTGGPDAGYNQAQADVTPMSEDQIYAYYAGKSATAIAAAQETEAAAEQEANLQSTQNTSQTNFSENAAGMAGSSEASGAANLNEATRGQAITSAMAQRDSTLATIASNITSLTQADFENQQNTVAPAYIAQYKANMQAAIQGLASNGITLQSLQSSNPVEYGKLLQAYNGDSNALAAAWIASTAPQQVGSPIQAGTNLIYTYKDPITGQMTAHTIDTGVQLNADYIATNVAGVGVVVTNKNTGDAHLVGGTANSLYTENQQATLNSKQAMLVSRYGTAVNGIIKQLFPSDSANPFNLYSNSLNYTAKLNAAYAASTSSSTPDKGVPDVDLIDSYIKIANGGGQITEAQIDALSSSLNLSGKAAITLAKLTGTSELLTDAQRQTIYQLAHSNIAAQKNNALNAVSVVQTRATAAGIPSQYVSTPDDILGLSAASDPTADANAATASSGDTSSFFTTSGQTSTVDDSSGNSITLTSNGNGTAMGSDGNTYDSDGNIISQ